MKKILKDIFRKAGLEIRYVGNDKKDLRKQKWINKNHLPYQIITESSQSIFFGYHDKTPINIDNDKLLATRVKTSGVNIQNNCSEVMEVGYYQKGSNNRYDEDFIIVDTTTTWCWQQGCMLQWNPKKPDSEIFFNKIVNEKYGSIIYDIETKKTIKEFSIPLYSLDPTGHFASSLNFSRLGRLRPGYGYKNFYDKTENEPCPDNDGVYLVDMRNGTSELVVSLSQLAGYTFKNVHHYVNHITFSPSGNEIVFFHIYQDSFRKRIIRFYLYHIAKKHLILLEASNRVSHYCWLNESKILTTEGGSHGLEYCIYDIQKLEKTSLDLPDIGDFHPMAHPIHKNIIVADTNPDINRFQNIFLFDIISGKNLQIGSFFSPEDFSKDVRCDLHPRWDRKGEYIIVDTPYKGRRSLGIIYTSMLKSNLINLYES